MKTDQLPTLSNRQRYVAASLLLVTMCLIYWQGMRWLLGPLAICGVILACWPRKGQ